MLEFFRLAMNVVSLVINVGLAYFAVRLILVFRGGKMERPWRYVSAGIVAVAVGSMLFSLRSLLALGMSIQLLGGLMMTLGGILALAGIYMEYRSWVQKG